MRLQVAFTPLLGHFRPDLLTFLFVACTLFHSMDILYYLLSCLGGDGMVADHGASDS